MPAYRGTRAGQIAPVCSLECVVAATPPDGGRELLYTAISSQNRTLEGMDSLRAIMLRRSSTGFVRPLRLPRRTIVASQTISVSYTTTTT